jgi:hypothetical protein
MSCLRREEVVEDEKGDVQGAKERRPGQVQRRERAAGPAGEDVDHAVVLEGEGHGHQDWGRGGVRETGVWGRGRGRGGGGVRGLTTGGSRRWGPASRRRNQSRRADPGGARGRTSEPEERVERLGAAAQAVRLPVQHARREQHADGEHGGDHGGHADVLAEDLGAGGGGGWWLRGGEWGWRMGCRVWRVGDANPWTGRCLVVRFPARPPSAKPAPSAPPQPGPLTHSDSATPTAPIMTVSSCVSLPSCRSRAAAARGASGVARIVGRWMR